jgi:hypothetical protein
VAGTSFGDIAAFSREAAPEGLVVYVEAAGHDAATICRNLHGMRLAGFFAGANAVLVGHTRAPSINSLTQHEAVLDALGSLGVRIIADVECGHTVPFMPIVNGALGRGGVHLRPQQPRPDPGPGWRQDRGEPRSRAAIPLWRGWSCGWVVEVVALVEVVDELGMGRVPSQ